MFMGSRALPVRRADYLTAICVRNLPLSTEDPYPLDLLVASPLLKVGGL
jgi:hypothetical protein